MLRAQHLKQKIETKDPITRLGDMAPFLFQPLFKTLCFNFFAIDFFSFSIYFYYLEANHGRRQGWDDLKE